MYYKNVSNSLRPKDPNSFANKFLNSKNNLDESVKEIKKPEPFFKDSWMKSNKDQSFRESAEKLPYKKVNKAPPFQMRSKINLEPSNKDRLNVSFDNVLKDSARFKNEDENELTFGNSIKKNNRVSSMNNMNIDYNKLICNNCLNTQLGTVRKLKNKDSDSFMNNSQELVSKFENFNENLKKQKEEKIKKREEMTCLAAEGIKQGGFSEKEALQRSCENQEFPLSKGCPDVGKKRVMEKNMIIEGVKEKIADKFLNSVKSEKEKYYEKYVDNKDSESLMNTIGVSPRKKDFNKGNYLKDLNLQVKKKEMIKERIDNVDRMNFLENILIYNKKLDNAEKEKLEKKNKLKQEFLEENVRLIERKNMKNYEMNYIEKTKEKLNIIKSNNEMEKQMRDTLTKKNQMKNDMFNGLTSQISDKFNRIRSQSQSTPDQTIFVKDTHVCNYPCSKCNKKFPLKMMNNQDAVFGKRKIY